MDKKRLALYCIAALALTGAYAQKNYSYQPITKSQQSDIAASMFANNVSSFLINDQIPIGYVSLTNVVNMVSYNPVEGTRIRISGQTNDRFSKRMAFSAMAAYGTEDHKFKYALGAAYNFAHKAKGVYAFPCSTLGVNWEDNTYMPSYSNYDVAYFSFGDWDRFYFARRKRLTVSFLQEFANTFAFRPYYYWQKTDDYMLYDDGQTLSLLDPAYDYTNNSVGVELTYTPTRKGTNLLTILNSRFYTFHTQIRADYSYNSQHYIQTNTYSRAEISAQHRVQFLPLALDVRVQGGKIFGQSDKYMYFTPNYRVSSVSNMFGFNLYSPWEIMCKDYVQTYTQLNFGGILLDNIDFFKNFKPNEFINFKALFSSQTDTYCEAGAGIDHIFGFLGLEIVKRISKESPYDMPDWALRIRCTL
ncbi:MAG: hypothetical protein IJ250_05665 [Bacteroidales bacterium]|nr:hypothetical protein [Bacteroidales bacterium]